ncbi:MAG TPA: L-lactate permease [Fimbriiglobus sp.]|nr:L-lactate permease [Fimbriiglobus sp.]
MLFAVYVQDLNPFAKWLTQGSQVASTLVAALPVLVLFYLLVGRRWLASWAGAAGAVTAIVIASAVYSMPVEMAGWAFVHGAAFGLVPIGLTVFAAMLLYHLTVETGQFAIIRRSIGGLSGDARVQAVLIGFCFGALLEGAAGSGTPVAICGAMLVGLGVPPFRAAVICLIANTSPVCYGGLGTPVLVLGNTTGLPADTISVMCGHQLPFLSCLIPLYMVKVMCTWRQTLAIWPVLLVGGGSFAVSQYTFATLHSWGPGFPAVWPMTDICGSIFSLVCLALFLKFVWRPRVEWKFPAEQTGAGQTTEPATPTDPNVAEAEEAVGTMFQSGVGMAERTAPLTPRRVALAWSPFVIMSACLVVAGVLREQEKYGPLDLGFARSYYEEPVPTLHDEVERASQLQKLLTPEMVGAVVGPLPAAASPDLFGTHGVRVRESEAAKFKVPWLTTPGAPVIVAVFLSALVLRTPPRTCWTVLRKTLIQMKLPIPTIACMLGLSYVTKYAGIDATLGVAFAETGKLYPFFAALLGWIGVFLTGTDAGSNALFGSLQKITAGEVFQSGAFDLSGLTRGQAEVLICTANSTGGVMGKMIDAQSICVATAGTNQIGREADIFKAVVWHSLLLACIVGLMTTVQAYVPPFTHMVPEP